MDWKPSNIMGDKQSGVNTRRPLGIIAPAFFSVSAQQRGPNVAQDSYPVRYGRPIVASTSFRCGRSRLKAAHLRMRTPRANNYQLTTPLLKRRIERRRRRVSIRRGGGAAHRPDVDQGLDLVQDAYQMARTGHFQDHLDSQLARPQLARSTNVGDVAGLFVHELGDLVQQAGPS